VFLRIFTLTTKSLFSWHFGFVRQAFIAICGAGQSGTKGIAHGMAEQGVSLFQQVLGLLGTGQSRLHGFGDENRVALLQLRRVLL
jgi:hypothetical protein